MEIGKFVKPIHENALISECFRSLVDFWKKNKEYPMRLAHGPYHLISVAYRAMELSRNNEELDGRANEVYIAGLLHEPSRTIGTTQQVPGMELHGEDMAKLAKEICVGAGITNQISVDEVLHAIYSHHDGRQVRNAMDQVLFVADKADMKIERVFGYVWDYNDECKRKGKEGFSKVADVYSAFLRKLYSVRSIIPQTQGILTALDVWDETLSMLNALTKGEAQGDIELVDCVELYALREASLNIAFLMELNIGPEDCYQIMGKYNDLLLSLTKGGTLTKLKDYLNYLETI